MENLAGREDCDEIIREELKKAGIEVVECPRVNKEVPYSVYGRLGSFEFKRAWSYWVAEGRVPIDVAENIYEYCIGKKDVRAGGHVRGLPPSEMSVFIDEEGRKLAPFAEKPDGGQARKIVEEDDSLRFVCHPSAVGEEFVTEYHIDSLIGLRFFANQLKEHNLV